LLNYNHNYECITWFFALGCGHSSNGVTLILIQGIIHFMKIKLLITGGTIDKVYNELTGELEFERFSFRENAKA